MKLARGTLLSFIILLVAAHTSIADSPTPIPQPTSGVVDQPTAGPVVVDTPIPVVSPVTESSPVVVAPEGSSPVVHVNQPGAAGPSPAPTSAQSVQNEGPTTFTLPTAVVPRTPGSAPGSSAAGATSSTGPAYSSPAAPGTDVTSQSQPDNNISSADLVALGRVAAAPSQLQCSGGHTPVAGPFMVAPYAGWTEITSFLDHANPDYGLDGRIVLANGLDVEASDGQASDRFPAYWSPALRQYVSYDGHNGYDFAIAYQPVLAAAAGTVTFAGWNDSSSFGGYGQMVLIDHHNGYVTLYGHLSKLEVQKGDKVQAGQEIGISGTTGNSSGPHLHFSVFHDCDVTDPYGWTGKASDPLTTFDGERAGYLWLPGHDPLVVNPPPGWPTFPPGLKVPTPQQVSAAAAARFGPPVDRLLLLALPTPNPGESYSPGVALARTESRITSEAERLVPELDALRSEGLVQAYQLVPDAAAVWVRGIANAAQLEALPGVASLAGVTPRDVGLAQAGLAHSLLIQIGNQRAPSLWPIGFRSALHAWRPVISVLTGQPLIAGTALPGQPVILSLHRGPSRAAEAHAIADPETGGFVAMLRGTAGAPMSPAVGDTVEVQSSGRTSTLRLLELGLRARRGTITGQGPGAASISVSVVPPSGERGWRVVTAASRHGLLKVELVRTLVAGTLAVASIVDDAGNQQSVAAYVPGAILAEGTGLVRGWAVGLHPRIRILRNGRILVDTPLHPARDGTFAVELTDHGQPVTLRGGDIVTLGSPTHPRSLKLPILSASFDGEHQLRASGPGGVPLSFALRAANGTSWTGQVTVAASGVTRLTLPHGHMAAGDVLSLDSVLRTGDVVRRSFERRTLTIHAGTPEVSGSASPGEAVSVRVIDRLGHILGSSAATVDPKNAAFAAAITTPGGVPLKLRSGMRLLIRDGEIESIVELPRFGVRADVRTGAIRVTGVKGGGSIILSYLSGTKLVRTVTPDRFGRAQLALGGGALARLARVSLSISLGDGMTALRSLQLHAPPSRVVRGGSCKAVTAAGGKLRASVCRTPTR